MTRVCPECSTRHDLDKYKGCCSRGCMYRFNRRNAPVRRSVVPWPRPKPLARPVIRPAPVVAPQQPNP